MYNTAGWPMEVKCAEQAYRFAVNAHSDTLVSYEYIINFGSPYIQNSNIFVAIFNGSDNYAEQCMSYILGSISNKSKDLESHLTARIAKSCLLLHKCHRSNSQPTIQHNSYIANATEPQKQPSNVLMSQSGQYCSYTILCISCDLPPQCLLVLPPRSSSLYARQLPTQEK